MRRHRLTGIVSAALIATAGLAACSSADDDAEAAETNAVEAEDVTTEETRLRTKMLQPTKRKKIPRPQREVFLAGLRNRPRVEI